MIQYTSTIPVFHFIYVGDQSEITDIDYANVLDEFIVQDTGDKYVFDGVTWGEAWIACVPVIEVPPATTGFSNGFSAGFK